MQLKYYLAASLVCGATLMACGDDEGSSTTDTGGSSTTTSTNGGSGGMATTTGTGGQKAMCNPPGQTGDLLDIAGAKGIQGTVQDLAGGPAADVLTDLCGSNICISAESDAMGNFSADTMGQLIDAAFVYGDGRGYAKWAAAIDTAMTNFGTVNTPALPAAGSNPDMAGGVATTSNGITITPASDADIKFGFTTPTGQRDFRAVAFAPTAGTFPALAIAGAPTFDGLIGAAPVESEICGGATLEVPNTYGYADGQTIELYVNGTDVTYRYTEFGQWSLIATGMVAGGNITFNDVPVLGTLGIKAQ